MRRRELVSLVLVALFGLTAPQFVIAQLPTDIPKEMWSAEWITSPDGPQRDVSVLHFRKLLDLSQPPQHFVVHVSADNQFILYVNQQRVGSGPARGDLAHWKFESYDLAPFLHESHHVSPHLGPSYAEPQRDQEVSGENGRVPDEMFDCGHAALKVA